MNEIADDLLARALRTAALEGKMAPLLDRLERGSNMPGRPNWSFARLVGAALDREPNGAPVVRALADGKDPFGRMVAAFALVRRLAVPVCVAILGHKP
jgi:hypothetical protein